MLDAKLLEHFANTFYGFGNYEGKYWCVGMEEGGHEDEKEIGLRLEAWKGRGGRELEDLPGTGPISPWFNSERPKLQPTWKMLIRIMLSAEGESDISNAQVLSFQQDSLGTSGGTNCLLELLPLPSPGVNRWDYDRYSELPYLKTREEYTAFLGDKRAQHISDLISVNRKLLSITEHDI